MANARRMLALLGGLILVTMLMACGMVTPSPIPSIPSSTPDASATRKPRPVDTLPPLDGGNSVGGSRIIAPVDGGAIEHATGTANYVDGTLLSYTVASDDNLEHVATRFSLSYLLLMSINAVRRDTTELFIGDTVNLSAFHMFSIGDQNGVVFDNQPPFPYPRDQKAADVP